MRESRKEPPFLESENVKGMVGEDVEYMRDYERVWP